MGIKKIVVDKEVYDIDQSVPSPIRVYSGDNCDGCRFVIADENRLYLQHDAGVMHYIPAVFKKEEVSEQNEYQYIGHVLFKDYRKDVYIYKWDKYYHYAYKNYSGDYIFIRIYYHNGVLFDDDVNNQIYKGCVLYPPYYTYMMVVVDEKGRVYKFKYGVHNRVVKEAIDEGLLEFLEKIANMDKQCYIGSTCVEDLCEGKSRVKLVRLYEKANHPEMIEDLIGGEGLPVRQLRRAVEMANEVYACEYIGDVKIKKINNYVICLYYRNEADGCYYPVAVFKPGRKEWISVISCPRMLCELYNKYSLSSTLDEEGIKKWASLVKRYGVEEAK